jgi:regulatory protein
MIRPKRPEPPRNAEDSALKALSRRDHSREEMRGKLLNRGFSQEAIDGALDRLAERGLIHDSRYANRLASSWAKEKLWGPLRIQQTLSAKGFSEEVIREATEKAEEALPTQVRLQRLLRQRPTKQRPERFSLKERKKLVQSLRQRGYLWEHLNDALAEAGGWEEE